MASDLQLRTQRNWTRTFVYLLFGVIAIGAGQPIGNVDQAGYIIVIAGLGLIITAITMATIATYGGFASVTDAFIQVGLTPTGSSSLSVEEWERT